MANAIHTMTINGAIRNASGKLVAFYDAESQTLNIDGFSQVFHVVDAVQAMEICGEKAPR